MVNDWEGTTISIVDVPVLTLDIAIAKYGIPFYLKLDVEGFEWQVLKGLTVPISLVSMEYHLTQEDIAKTRMCVARLWELGMRFFNASPAETPQLLLPKWLPLEAFETSFPNSLEKTGDLRYGDLWFSTVDEPRSQILQSDKD